MKKRTFTIALLLAPLALFACESWDTNVARKAAGNFATETLQFKDPVVNCQNVDSDNDGYVSCTVVEKGKPETAKGIECSGYMSRNSGCRLATGKSRRY